MLVYPNFDISFEVHTDSSDYQLGGVVAQKGKPLFFLVEATCNEAEAVN